MSELTPDIADQVLDACRAGAAEAAEALSRALDAELTLEVGGSGVYSPEAPPAGFDGPGLAVLFTFGDRSAAALLPAAGGLLPPWAEAPDATGASKLATLAQELSMLLVPESLMADASDARYAPSLAEALGRAKPAAGSATATLTLKSPAGEGTLTLVWPLEEGPGLFAPTAPTAAAGGEGANGAEATEATQASGGAAADRADAGGAPPRRRITDFSELPPLSRSLLRVPVTVSACLATKKQSIQEIMALGPGAIVMFEKPCDSPIDLLVGDALIASGGAVKVGEKFGIRIERMILPGEKFVPVRAQRRPA